MFYRIMVFIGALLVATPCLANNMIHFVRGFNTEISRAKLPYIKKLGADTLSTEEAKKIDLMLRKTIELEPKLGIYEKMEAIKTQATEEASELHAFAAKFFAAVSKYTNTGYRDISYSPYFRLVDTYKHLLPKEYVEELDSLYDKMREITDKDLFIEGFTEADMNAHTELENKYIAKVVAGFKETGATALLDLLAIADDAALQGLTDDLQKKIDTGDTAELLKLFSLLNTIEHLGILRQVDHSVGGNNFQNAARGDYGFTNQEADDLQHLLDLHNKSEHLILDYFADNITQGEFSGKMDDLLTTHGEVLSAATRHEIGQQLAALR